MKARSLRGPCDPGADSTPLATSTPNGSEVGDRLGHVVGGRARPRRSRGAGSTTPSPRRQSNTSPEPGLGPSIRTSRRRTRSKRAMARSPAREGLDASADPLAHPPAVLGRLVTVQLDRPEPDAGWRCRPPADGPRPGRRPTVRTSWGRRLTMSATVAGDTWRGDGAKTKPDGVGAEPDGEQRVLLRRDAADLDEEAVAHRPGPPRPRGQRHPRRHRCPRRRRTAPAGSPERHERLADEDGVVAGGGQPLGVGRRRRYRTRRRPRRRRVSPPPARSARSGSTSKVRQVALVDPDQRRPRRRGPGPARPRRAPRRARRAPSGAARRAKAASSSSPRAATMSSTASAPMSRASHTSAALTGEVLAQHRQPRGRHGRRRGPRGTPRRTRRR